MRTRVTGWKARRERRLGENGKKTGKVRCEVREGKKMEREKEVGNNRCS